MRAWIIPTLALLVIGGAGFGVGWAVNEWRDGDSNTDDELGEAAPQESPEPTATPMPTPAPYQPRFTQAEAAATLEREHNRNAWQVYDSQQVTPVNPDSEFAPPPETLALLEALRQVVFLVENCKTAEFKETSRAWIVQCTDIQEHPDTGNRIEQGLGMYRLLDETGEWNQVSGPGKP